MKARIPRIVATILAITFSTTLFSQDFILNDRTIVKTGEDYTTTDGSTTFKVLGNEVVVKYVNGTSDLEKASLENTLGLTKLREASTGFIDYRLGEGSDYFSILQAMESSPLVETVEVAMEGFYVLDPNDPLFPQQWYLQQANDADIDAPEAFDITMGSNGVVVAILDSGTDWTHEDIGMGPDAYQNVFLNAGEDAWADPNDPATGNGIDDDGNGLVDDWKGWDFVNNNNDSRGPFFHGTHVAGIVSAKSNNNLGMASVAGGNNSPGTQLLLVGVGDNAPSGNILDDAILYAANTGASIIQLSLTVGQTADIDAAIAAANAQGVLIVCAAGNSNGPVGYPARNPAVVAVGGTNQNDGKAGFASFGVDLDISAPAVDILSTQPGDAYNTSSGTSFAAPQVSAAAALLLSRNPCLSNDQIKQIFQFSADKVGGFNYNWNANMPGHSLELGYGRLNLRAALSDQTVLDVHIDQNTTFNSDMVISGNIYVHTGAQLTITSTIQFGKDKGIIVERGAKLHVNGGTLTKCPDGEDWRGINVEGNASMPQPDATSMPAFDEAGVVLIDNLAHVEWARTAISTTRFNQGWNSAYWGGMVHCEDATFFANGRVAEFMKYDIDNQSKFDNCTMDAGGVGYAGATIWDTDNVTFNRCRFYNMSSQGILTYDAGAIVKDGNDFHHNRWGISSRATYPFSSYLEVGDLSSDPNYFLDNWFHIESYASNKLDGLKIINNEFFDSNVAIWLVGPSKFFIEDNAFDVTVRGTHVFQTGSLQNNQHNYIRYNAYSGSRGVAASGENRELQILCNDFLTNGDLVVRQMNNGGTPGEIRDRQGNSSAAAGNCFTDPGQVTDITTENQTVFFRYYIYGEGGCTIPLNPGNYATVQALGPGCTDGGGFPNEPTYEDYTNIKNQIAIIQGNGGQPEEQLSDLLESKEYVLLHLLGEYLEQGNIQASLQILDEENTTSAKLMKYGLQVDAGQFSDALSTLDSLPDEVGEMATFKQIQYINLDRLQAGLFYELSEPDSLFLESVAMSDMGVKAYARSILGLLTGREFHDEDAEEGVGQRSGQPQAGKTDSKENVVSVFPNPSEGGFTVVIPEDLGVASIQLNSVLGQIVYEEALPDGTHLISATGQDWGSGIYILNLFDENGKVVHSEKLVLK